MRLRPLALASILGLSSCLQAETPTPIVSPKPHDFAKWEKSVAAFEAADAQTPPPKGAVLFVGSSTIVRWKTLAEDFKGTTVLNRGFGGNQIVDSTHYADRMIFPYEPRMIVLRAGGNDINAGKKAAEVFQDYKDFVAKMRTRLPDIEIVYLGLSPTIKRWAQVEEGNRLNDLIAAYCNEQPNLNYVDCKTLTLDAEGKPRPELMVDDKLHFSAAGYKLLVEKVRPFIPKD